MDGKAIAGPAAYDRAPARRLGGARPSHLLYYPSRQPQGTEAPNGARLLSLEQRAALKGAHARLRQAIDGRRYVAGVALPDALRPGAKVVSLYPRPVTLTILEIDSTGATAAGILRVVEHCRWEREPDGLIDRLRAALWDGWGCQAVLADSAEATGLVLSLRPRGTGIGELAGQAVPGAGLCSGLVRAIDAGRVKIYAEDGSSESREFWSQAIRARRRVGVDGAPEFFMEPGRGDDGFLVSLALAVGASALPEQSLAAVVA